MEIYMCVFAVCVTAIIIAYMLITQNSNENSNVNLTFEKKDEPQIYGNKYNCIMTMFGECSYAETGCGDCAVVEKVRKALTQTEPNYSEKPNNCDEPQKPKHGYMWTCPKCGTEHHSDFESCPCCGWNRIEDEPQTYITEDRDTQILDAWQVYHRSTTSVEDKSQTERSK